MRGDRDDAAQTIEQIRHAYGQMTRALMATRPQTEALAVDLVSGLSAELVVILRAIRDTYPDKFPALLEQLLECIRKDALHEQKPVILIESGIRH